ncbi:uncharacterized protein LOC124404902 [Diprion similis]|uniref:uncharacterized protein LOC124404902 n=1 Tax=Diprion similis TaxID=362088 RepID=UPI001EF90F82|nr:uncharacterized protein LOC124404902 [Diprion similis]
MSRKNNKDVVSFSVSQSSLHSSTHHIDEDELTSVCDFEEDNRAQVIDLSGFDGNTHRTIVVNMTESSDVEIKPATQFYAPVTIHQHYNTTSTHPNANPPVAPPVTSTESINYRDKLEKETNSRFTTTSHAKINFCSSATSRNLVYILGIVVGLIITVTFIVTIIYFTIPSRNDEKNELRPHLPD